MRPDRELFDLDLDRLIAAGLVEPGPARAALFAAGAVAAALRLERMGVGPYPVGYLASTVRAAGLPAVAALPEPLLGAGPSHLMRSWLVTATGDHADVVDVARDDLFAGWLETVATVLSARRTVVRPTGDRA